MHQRDHLGGGQTAIHHRARRRVIPQRIRARKAAHRPGARLVRGERLWRGAGGGDAQQAALQHAPQPDPLRDRSRERCRRGHLGRYRIEAGELRKQGTIVGESERHLRQEVPAGAVPMPGFDGARQLAVAGRSDQIAGQPQHPGGALPGPRGLQRIRRPQPAHVRIDEHVGDRVEEARPYGGLRLLDGEADGGIVEHAAVDEAAPAHPQLAPCL